MGTKPSLSKSRYLKGQQCELALWYALHPKSLKAAFDMSRQQSIALGHELGELAKQSFPGGVEVVEKYWNIHGAVQKTQEFIAAGQTVIFEATAINQATNTNARIDVLKKVPGSDEWDMIEVKGSAGVKDYHLEDMAFQYHVFTGAGYKIRNCQIMIVDTSYVRAAKLDIKKLFKLEDITQTVKNMLGKIPAKTAELHDVMGAADEPKVDIGAQCNKPFSCEYKDHCWKDVPLYSVFNVLAKEKAAEVAKQVGGYEITRIPLNQIPRGGKTIEVECHKTGKPYVDQAKIRGFLNQLVWPVRYLDFECVSNMAVPPFKNLRPYQQIPFQFSVDVQDNENAGPVHREFLHKRRTDPRKAFVKKLIKLCGDKGSIVVYSKDYESKRNEELAQCFPEYKDQLLAINARMVDLLVPFRSRWLYHPAQNGSASLKAVVPAWTKLSYQDMQIAGGMQATEAYAEFIKRPKTPAERQKLWNDLLAYCGMDTHVMVELIKTLKSLSGPAPAQKPSGPAPAP